ncbi:MAG: NAD(P)H-binding protein [Cryobacterium sp.]|nr:NAD(P)H-binding protein [Cryobacterium sp.]
MKIVVAGGTGLVGSQVAARLRDAGHDVASISRREGVNLLTGDGLDAALAGADAVIDCSNVDTLSRSKAVEFFSTVARNVGAAASTASVSRIVVLSIVGIDRIPFGYYEGKLAQEQEYRASGVPLTILRATQFFEFAETNLARVPGPFALIPRMLTQAVASSEVAGVLIDLATTPAPKPRGEAIVELAGPEQHQLVDLARRVARARRMRKLVIPVTLPGAASRPMATGALRPEGDDYLKGTITFTEWLSNTLQTP